MLIINALTFLATKGLTIGGAVLSAGDVTGPEGIVVHLKRAGETVGGYRI